MSEVSLLQDQVRSLIITNEEVLSDQWEAKLAMIEAICLLQGGETTQQRGFDTPVSAKQVQQRFDTLT